MLRALILALTALALVAIPPAFASPCAGAFPTCMVSASLGGFTPPAIQIFGEANVFLGSLDRAHTFTEEALNPCFDVAVSPDSGGFLRVIADDGLVLVASGDGESFEVCSTASETSTLTSAGVIRYVCTLHPWMRGAISTVS